MALTAAEVAGIMRIKTRDKLPLLFERDSLFFGKILKRPADKVSNLEMRIPLKVQPGGNFGSYNPNGGDLGRGSGTLTNFATVTPVNAKTAVEINLLADWTTNSDEKAIEKAVKMNLADIMPQFRTDMDCVMQTAGNGVLATVASVSSLTITLENLPFGARLLREQLNVSVYDSTLVTNRGSMAITQVNKQLGSTQSIVVDAVPGGTTGTDVIVVGGLSGASPTYFFGIPYFHNTSASGTNLGLSRALNYMRANGVDVNGAGLNVPAGQLALDQIRQSLGDDMVGKLFWHLHPAQQAAIQNLKLQISQIIKTGSRDQDVDLGFRLDSSFLGVPTVSNIHADPTRIDAINLETWGRAEYKALDYLTMPNGDMEFEIRGASGGVAAAFVYYLVLGMQCFVDNSRAITSVTDLATPSGYIS